MTDSRAVSRSLRLAREVFSPSPAEYERVRSALIAQAQLRAQTGKASGGGSAAEKANATGPRRYVSGRFGALKAAAFLGIGFALGYWVAEARRPEPGPIAAARPGAGEAALGTGNPAANGLASVEPTATQEAAPPTALPAPTRNAESSPPAPKSRHARVAPLPRVEASTKVEDGFVEELGLLQRAERAIRGGDGALARSFVADLEARFPKTTWREERAAILVLAACALSEPGAERDARAFLDRRSGSVYLDRIRAVCRLDAFEPESIPTADGSGPRGH